MTTEILRELIFDFDEVFEDQTSPSQIIVRLEVHPDRADTDANKWRVSVTGEPVGFHNSSGEEKSRRLFDDEVRRILALEEKAKAEGRFAEARFAIGRIDADR